MSACFAYSVTKCLFLCVFCSLVQLCKDIPIFVDIKQKQPNFNIRSLYLKHFFDFLAKKIPKHLF